MRRGAARAAAPVLLAAAAPAAGAPRQAGWVNTTVYRLTPNNLTTLLNVNSADAAGDVMFGMNQMLLPVLCPVDPGMSWCKSSHPHKGGPVPLVYTQFVVSSDPRKGSYAPCNPDEQTGVYQCGSYHSTEQVPPQCQTGYHVHHHSCLNGTVYRSLPELTGAAGEGACCAACTADDKCRGWVMPDGVNGSGCELLTDPIVRWEDAYLHSQCRGADKDPGSSANRCWNDDPRYAGFDSVCDPAQCACAAIDTLSLGVEYGAMCESALAAPPRASGAAAAPGGRAAAVPPGGYWSCAAGVFDRCAAEVWSGDGAKCRACAAAVAGCSDAGVAAACSPDPQRCAAAVWARCGRPAAGDEYGCAQCAFAPGAEPALRAAGCNASLVNEACGAGGGRAESKWGSYIDRLACKMNGTWYSTQGAGRCNTTDPSEGCWWRVADATTTKAQECVEGRLVAAVRARNASCWTPCPQPDNSTTACYLECLFSTIFNDALPAAVLSDIFAAAFLPESAGGCPEAPPPPAPGAAQRPAGRRAGGQAVGW